MTLMSPAIAWPSRRVGNGWIAEVSSRRIILAVEADDGTALTEALDSLMSPALQRFWGVTWSHEDDYGMDVYVIRRDNSE